MVGATIGNVYGNSGKSEYSDPNIPGTSTSNNNNYGISLDPSLGWFISDNTAVGGLITLGYRHQKIFDESGGNTYHRDITRFFSIGIGGFIRNYFNTTGNLKPFGQVSANFGIGSSNKEGFFITSIDKSTFDGKSSSDFFANAGISLGLTKMLNDYTGLDFFAGYNFSYDKNTFKTTTQVDDGPDGSIDQTNISNLTTKYTNHGFAIGAGFQVFLNRKK